MTDHNEMFSQICDVLAQVADEAFRQEECWPGQHLPDGLEGIDASSRKAFAEWGKSLVSQAKASDHLAWKHLLDERFFATVSEVEWPEVRLALVQLMALALRWVMDGDTRKS